MVQPVMSAVITDISEDASRKDRHRDIPVIPKDGMCKLVEGKARTRNNVGGMTSLYLSMGR